MLNQSNIRILPTGWFCPRCLRMNAPTNNFCTCKEKSFTPKMMIKVSKEEPIDPFISQII